MRREMRHWRPRATIRDALIRISGRLRRSGARGRARVIALHEVTDAARFRRRLDWLRRRFEIVPLGDTLADRDTARADVPSASARPRVALTLDDGYASWAENAAPALIELRLPATFFVSSGLVGLSGDEWRAFRRDRLRRTRELQPLTAAQLAWLGGQELFEIGGHTTHHADLASIADEGVIEDEVRRDREALAQLTGRPPRWFAYPFGAPENIHGRAARIVRAAGYEAAWSIVPGFVEPDADRFALPRDCLDLEADEEIWRARLDGAWDGLARVKRAVFGRAGEVVT